MSRQKRIVLPDTVYHVMSRGNERQNIYRDPDDRHYFLKILQESRQKYEFKLYAYVLMSNHYHLLLKIKNPNLSEIMRCINTKYCVYFNRKYKRVGHLLQGRFKHVLVEFKWGTLEELRYIHMNPIRAGMAETLKEYPWSSHFQYAGGEDTGTAQIHDVLAMMDPVRAEAVKKYEKYISEASYRDRDGDIVGYYGQQILGSPDYVRKIKLLLKDKKLPDDIANRWKLKNYYTFEEIAGPVCRYYDTCMEVLAGKKGKWNKAKKVLTYLLIKDAGLKNTEIARLLNGLHSSGIGKTRNRIEAELKDDKKLEKEIKSVRDMYYKTTENV